MKKEGNTPPSAQEEIALVASEMLSRCVGQDDVLATALCNGHAVTRVGLAATDVAQLLIVEPTKLLDGRFVSGFRKLWRSPARNRRDRQRRQQWLEKRLCCAVDVTWDGVYEVHAGDDPGPLVVVKHAALCAEKR